MQKESKSLLLSKFNNLSIYRKIFCAIITVTFLTFAAALISIKMIADTNNRLIYQTMAGSLSYSATDISEKLSALESMTNMILTDTKVQSNLSTVADAENSMRRSIAYNSLAYIIPEYHQNFKNNGINYIDLFTPSYTISSYPAKSNKIPSDILSSVLEKAQDNPGYPCWTTDTGNEYGFFLSRTIRRADELKLDYLGTIVVSVNIRHLVKDATRSVVENENVQYVLYDETSELYHTEALSEGNLRTLSDSAEGTYGVIHLDQHPYFYVCGSIPDFGWKYMCLVPYDTILNPQRTTLLFCMITLAIFAATGLLLSRRIVQSITGHLRQLIWKMKEFGKDEGTLPVTSYDYSLRRDEIGELHQQFDHMAQKIQKLIEENYVQELLAKEARLKALENQINPHFLYNTLDAVYWRAMVSGEETISTMVESLAVLFRSALSQKDVDGTIAHELDLVHHFMTIQKIRFDDRLQYTETIEPGILDLKMPHLIIQPLVENAISHALEEMTDTCFIQISGECRDGKVYIQVVNNGSQFEDNLLYKLETNEVTPRGFGIGLLNIHKRLQLIYGLGYGLTLFNPDDDHAAAQICIPLDRPGQ